MHITLPCPTPSEKTSLGAGTTNMTEHSTNVEERLSRLEATVETFVHTVQRDISDITSSIDALRSGFNDSAKPQWQTVFAGMGILLLLGGFIGQWYVRDLHRVEQDVVHLTDTDVATRIEQAAHTAAFSERMKAVEREVFPDEHHP